MPWRSVSVPADWRSYSLHGNGTLGEYTRTFVPTPWQAAAAAAGRLHLALGTIASADATYIDGVRVGMTGKVPEVPGDEKLPPSACGSQLLYRSYLLPRHFPLTAGSTHNLTCRVYNPHGNDTAGGLVDTEPRGGDYRSGPYDAGASAGLKQTAYTVGSAAWYRTTLPLTAAQRAAVSAGASLVYITFEAAYMNAMVWLDETYLGEHPYAIFTCPSRSTTPCSSPTFAEFACPSRSTAPGS